MAFLTGRDDDTQESLDELEQEIERAFLSGELDEAERNSRLVQLEARRALLSVAPVPDANVDARLKDLEYLHEKGWVGDEEYEAQRREILGM